MKTKKRDQCHISLPWVGVNRGQENRKGVRPRLQKGNAEEVWAGHLKQESMFEEVVLEGGPSWPRRNSPRKAVGCHGVGLREATEGENHTQDCFPSTIYSPHCQPFLWVIRYETTASKAHPSCQGFYFPGTSALSHPRQLFCPLTLRGLASLVCNSLTQS